MHSPSQFQVPAIVIATPAEGDTMCSEGRFYGMERHFGRLPPFFLQIVIVRGHGNEKPGELTARGKATVQAAPQARQWLQQVQYCCQASFSRRCETAMTP